VTAVETHPAIYVVLRHGAAVFLAVIDLSADQRAHLSFLHANALDGSDASSKLADVMNTLFGSLLPVPVATALGREQAISAPRQLPSDCLVGASCAGQLSWHARPPIPTRGTHGGDQRLPSRSAQPIAPTTDRA
jgi:hypothetical protein